ncbi:FAD-dependent oxidoreductase [Thermodesulfobacteriota bacterium]
MSDNKKRVIILGAGPCGLTAAWELSNKGYDVVVIEKDGEVGGLCKTTSHRASAESFTPGETYRFDLGGHRFITKNKRLMTMVTDLMREDMLVAHRKSVILLREREFEYPLNIKNLFKNLDFTLFMRAGIDYLLKPFLSGSVDDKSFEGWIKTRYGKTLYDLFFGPYTEKLWGISPTQISSDWAVQRISALDLKDMILNLMKLKNKEKRTFTKRFFYPKEGIGQIFDKMQVAVEQNGGKIYFNSRAESVESVDGSVRAVTINENGERKRIECDHLISTIPVDGLCDILVDDGEKGVLPKLSYRSLRFLNVLVDKEKISDNTWLYVSEAKYFMTRIQEPKKRSPFSAPDGKTSVMLEIPCNVGDETYSCSDEKLFDRGMDGLKALGFDLKGLSSDFFTTYADHAYPVYSLDYKENVAELIKVTNRYDNLITCGRQGLFRYIFMDTAMEMGLLAADKIMGSATMADIHSVGLEKDLLEVKSIV